MIPSIAGLLLIAALAPGEGKVSNDLVGLDVGLRQSQLKPGETGQVIISFKPKKGIHVTTDPPFEFSIDTLGHFFSVGDKAEFVTDTKGYVNPSRPVRQPFIVSRDTPAGTYEVKATLIYYYCSDNEGWCSRFKQPVRFSVKIAK
jgi:hypothetical protein